jgi:hypothetical protein
LIDRREVVTLAVSALVSASVTKALDGSWILIAAITAAALLLGVAWTTFGAFRRLLARVNELEQAHAHQVDDVQRLGRSLVTTNKQQGESVTALTAEIVHQSAVLGQRLVVVEVASLPSWLSSAAKHAEKNGWTVRTFGNDVQFEHANHDPIAVCFPLGDEKAAKDALFEHLAFVPYAALLNASTRVKRIGGRRSAS